MAALSQKAKGKQRAVDEIPSEDAATASQAHEPHTRDLTVRFTEGVPDLMLSIAKEQSVRDIKRTIRVERPQLRQRRLKLIHSGRVLTDGTFLYDWLSSLEERQHRAAAANGSTDSASTPSHPSKAITWLHCSIGPQLEQGDREGEEKAQTAQLRPLRGFDRLAAAGFSADDIANFRSQFHAQLSGDHLDSNEFETEEEYDDHARALEEQWIDSMDSPSTANLSGPGSNLPVILQGVLVGFFFPILPLFFMREPKPPVFWEDGREHEDIPSVIFSKRMQMWLVIGFLVNILFGMWRYLLDVS